MGRPLPWGHMLLAVLAVAGLWLGELAPAPWGPRERLLLDSAGWPAFGLSVALLAAWAAWLVTRAGRPDMRPEPVGDEEPLLAPSRMVPVRASAPVVAFAGLEPGAGVSTLVFNIAVLVATLGQVTGEEGARSPRPVCLLSEGALTDALRLSPLPLDWYVREHPFQLDAGVLDVAADHPSGAELVCLKYQGRAVRHLRALVAELRRHYDVVLVDGWRGGRHLLDLATGADALVLVGTPAARSVEAAGGWIERVWALGLEGRTALVLNRVRAWPPPPRALHPAFPYHAELEYEPRVVAWDRRGLPWSVDGELPVAERCAEIARLLFPSLLLGRDAGAS